MPKSVVGLEFIKNEEAFRARWYVDQAGIWTIGYGTTDTTYERLTSIADPVKNVASVTKPEAENLIQIYLDRYVIPTLDKKILRKLNDNQYGALVSLVYNIGAKRFADSALLRKINEGKFVEAAEEFNSWIYYTDPSTKEKKVSRGLRNRRAREKALFESKDFVEPDFRNDTSEDYPEAEAPPSRQIYETPAPENHLPLLTRLDVKEEYEELRLSTLPTPGEGELDIGDLRFGAVLGLHLDDRHLNQPTSLTQQNAGSIGIVENLRTDMGTIIGDNTPLPEVLVTISLNATIRDDVNRMLRPLVAQQRRMPFTVARNPDIARLMLGLGVASDNKEQLRKAFPNVPEEELDELAEHFSSRNPADVWVPVTIRSINVASQPGAPNLFQVHVVLRFANIQPYVPRLQFWKRTTDALAWAKYLGARSYQGAEVLEMSGDVVTQQLPHGPVVTSAPPDLSQQTDDPNQSYVFKKFYRGLLEEFQGESIGGAYNDLLDQGLQARLEPIGFSVPGESNTATNPITDSDRVYEPAYPIVDPERLFETYKPNSDIVLEYKGPRISESRAERLAKLTAAFQQRNAFIQLLRSARNLYTATGNIKELENLGKISPLTLSIGRDLTLILNQIQSETSILNSIATQFQQMATSGEIPAPNSVQEFYISAEDGTIGTRTANVAPLFTDETAAAGVVTQIDSAAQDGFMNFIVAETVKQERFVNFSEKVKELQESVLLAYAKTIWAIETNTSLKSEWSRLLSQHRQMLVDKEGVPETVVDEYLRTHLLSFSFIHGNDHGVPGLMSQSWVPEVHKNTIRELIEYTTELTSALSDSINAEKKRISDYYTGGLGAMTGVLNLDSTLTTIEAINLGFSNRYGDSEWDGYSQASSQHIGGGNATISLSITTADPFLLDQLGNIRTAQLALSDLRKGRDIVPSLIDIYGEGNILRAFGIKRLAYRNHTITMSEAQPGYYQIRLEFVQDESTLIRHEKVTTADDIGITLFHSGPSKGVLLPLIQQNYKEPGKIPFVQGPESVLRFLKLIYPDGPEPEHWAAFGRAESKIDRLSSILDQYVRLVKSNPVQSFKVQFVKSKDRTNPSQPWKTVLRYQDLTTRKIDINNTFGTLAAFLDTAETQLSPAMFTWLIGQVERLLSTSGHTAGYLISLFRLSALLVASAAGSRTEPRAYGIGTGAPAPASLSPNAFVQKTGRLNLTLEAGSLLAGGAQASSAASLAPGIRMIGDEFTRLIASNDELYSIYKVFMEGGGYPKINANFTISKDNLSYNIYDFSTVIPDLDNLRSRWDALKKRVPTCYPDLLMPELQDQEMGINLIGYDFPFGPGVSDLTEDDYLRDYELAEAMHEVNQISLATIGMDIVSQYVTMRDEDADQQDIFVRVFGGVLDSLHSEVERLAGDVAFPFSLKDGNLKNVAEWMHSLELSKAATRQGSLTKRDWVNLLRITETLRYTAYVTERAKVELEGSLSNDDVVDLAKRDIRSFLKGVENKDLIFSNIDRASLGQTYSVTSNIQNDDFLLQQRRNLIYLYAGDEEIITRMLGYTDVTSTEARAELRKKIQQRWNNWFGMRKAFPTYMLLIASPVGVGSFRVLADLYAYTAIQSVEIRSMKENAGQYCDLVVSNMRWRLGNAQDSARALIFDSERDLTLDIKPGTYMHVYLGYGPDIANLYPFAGRVTDYRPGPQTAISLSSYSTTLNNPPSEGRGFFVNGWDAQSSIGEAILYTISQTTGLEGLGRGALSSTLDILGRTDRGGEGDDFKTTLATSFYRSLGKPFMGSNLISTEARTGMTNLVDLVSELGLSSLKGITLGDPRLYENVYFGATRPRYGWSNMLFGGFANWLSNGSGWGWAALPNETCWSQLHDQSLLFPDYVVTTRPYNVGVPLTELAHHPLRQTLYFGPKHGVYTHTSSTRAQDRPFNALSTQEMIAIQNKYFETADGSLESNYIEIFLYSYTVPLMIEILTTDGTLLPGFLDDFYTWLRTGFRAFSGVLGSGFRSSVLRNEHLTESQLELFYAQLTAAFPNTTEFFRANIPREPFTAQQWINTLEFSRDDSDILKNDFTAVEAGLFKAGMLAAFRNDLFDQAIDSRLYQNLSNTSDINPLVRFIRTKLEEQGYRPDSRHMPIAEHWFTNTYQSVIHNDIRAVGGSQGTDQDFANRILLSFPRDPSDRLNAYNGQRGDLYMYAVQANPQIDPDYIVEHSVYYPNLRSVLLDDAGIWSAQIERYANKEQWRKLLHNQEDLNDAIANKRARVNYEPVQITIGNQSFGFDGQPREMSTEEALLDTEGAIFALIQEVGGPSGTKPKFQTVANNILRDRLGYMYQGSLTLQGDPRLHPYHVLHLWDDVKQMHGPVEVGSVYHTFTSAGFYTIVEPRLMTSLRGVDPTLDTLYIQYAAHYNSYLTFAKMIGRGAIASVEIAGRAWLYSLLHSGITKLAKGILSKGAASAIPGVGVIALADTVYQLVDLAATTGEEHLTRFISIMATASDLNPVVMLPLTYKQQAYVAGLTGAIGPATMRSTIIDAINDDIDNNLGIGALSTIDAYLRAGLQTN